MSLHAPLRTRALGPPTKMSFFTSLQQMVSDAGSSLSESARKLVATSSRDSAGGQESDEGATSVMAEPPKLQLPTSGGRNSLTPSSSGVVLLQPPEQHQQRRRSSLFALPVALGGGGGEDGGGTAPTPSWPSMWLQPSSAAATPTGGPATWDTSPGGLSRSRRNSSIRWAKIHNHKLAWQKTPLDGLIIGRESLRGGRDRKKAICVISPDK